MVDKNFIPTREVLLELRNSGMNREQIGKHYGVKLSRVKRWFQIHEFKRPERKNPFASEHPTAELPADYGMTLMDKAKAIFGTRLKEDKYRGYILDGKPIRADDVLLAAQTLNKVAVKGVK